jgi:hypothetical protein
VPAVFPAGSTLMVIGRAAQYADCMQVRDDKSRKKCKKCLILDNSSVWELYLQPSVLLPRGEQQLVGCVQAENNFSIKEKILRGWQGHIFAAPFYFLAFI